MATDYCFAWWNLENLFDIYNSSDRPAWLQNKLKTELKGWNTPQLNTKIAQLARVIRAMNDNAGPDLLGVCEVESQAVLTKLIAALDLPSRHYGIAHADIPARD